MVLSYGRPSIVTHRGTAELAVYDKLDEIGIEYSVLDHEAASTMEICRQIEDSLEAPICKNLFLCNRQQTDFYLLMLPGDKVFKTKYLSSQLSCARLSFAGADKMAELLNIQPGAVSPMGLIFDSGQRVRLIIDRDLLDCETFCCHPCVNSSTVRLRMADFLMNYLPAVHHSYTVVTLPAE